MNRALRCARYSRLLVEELESRRLLAIDFGDAPEFYPTTLAEDGARHDDSGPTLGSTRDGELDGIHSPGADADDIADADDEDGVIFGTIFVGQTDAVVMVDVQNAPTGARLDAWIDFNGDGSWGGPGEQIFDSRLLTNNTVHNLMFDVPSWAASGTSYARFRLSMAGDLGVGGPADDGEVEDYQFTIDPPGESSGVFGGQKTISGAAAGAQSVFSADVDGDGDLDVLSASLLDNTIAWYENDGAAVYVAHTITTSALNATSVFAADVDGDGDTDVLSASRGDNTIAWYENNGGAFTAHTISDTAAFASSVFAADVDGDGDLDVLSASANDHKIAWYENDGSENFTPHTISTNAIGAASVYAADVDGDGDLDVLSASIFDSKIAWYENDGNQVFSERLISLGASSARSVFAADLDGDGDLDVLSASQGDGKIAWYENDGNNNFAERVISLGADGAIGVFAADVDGDGDLDVLSASQGDSKIAWYENDGNRNFTLRTISTAAGGAYSVFAADLDGDGDLDALSASTNDNKVAWYENFAFDFGDAPASYATTLAEDGPRHDDIGPKLGAARDFETDGTDSVLADADDTSGSDDEDGVSFPTLAIGGTAPINVTISGSLGNARLYGWIDFNGDGDFSDPGEQIANGSGAFENLGNGVVNIGLTIPESSVAGNTFARFRVSTQLILTFGGVAIDGEVEDYAISILAASPLLNADNRFDVNDDDNVDVLDILALIADVRANGFHAVPGPIAPPPFTDVTGNYFVDIFDILGVVGFIRSGGEPEGEAESRLAAPPRLPPKAASPLPLDFTAIAPQPLAAKQLYAYSVYTPPAAKPVYRFTDITFASEEPRVPSAARSDGLPESIFESNDESFLDDIAPSVAENWQVDEHLASNWDDFTTLIDETFLNDLK